MFEWITNNANELKGVGTLLGGIGTAYGSYVNYKAQKEANDINKTLLNRQIAKEDKAQKDLEEGFNLSLLSQKNDDTQLIL
jgi:hypothetical protein